MHGKYAYRRSRPQPLLWASAFLSCGMVILGAGCASCKQGSPAAAECSADFKEDICTEIALPDAGLGRTLSICNKTSRGAVPSIQAYYIDQTIPRELFLADILAENEGHSECAPGPYLFDNDSEIDADGKRWQLSRMPNYFLLQLAESTNDENFYIANQNGFPVNCQSFKLRQQKNSTLVLVPRTKLEAGKGYYLYLILNQGESRRTWIQPITLAIAEK